MRVYEQDGGIVFDTDDMRERILLDEFERGIRREAEDAVVDGFAVNVAADREVFKDEVIEAMRVFSIYQTGETRLVVNALIAVVRGL